MKHSHVSKKPIVHGYSDPTEIPYWCKRCVHCNHTSTGYTCDRREDGKFKPEIDFSCRKLRPVSDTEGGMQ